MRTRKRTTLAAPRSTPLNLGKLFGSSNKATMDKTSGAARPGRGAQDPFDALFSQKGR